MMHIAYSPPISTKFIIVPLFSFSSCLVSLIYVFYFLPHALHAMDAPAYICIVIPSGIDSDLGSKSKLFDLNPGSLARPK